MSTTLLPHAAKPKPSRAVLQGTEQQVAWILLAVLSAATLLLYLDSIWMISDSWRNPQYSHGFLVPLFAIGLLWWRHEPLRATTNLERWCGVGLIALSLAVRIHSAYYTRFTPDNTSLIPCLAGVFLLVGGWRALRWAGLPLAFLIFMYPWPDVAERLILVQLKQFVAMPVSLYVLQTLGVEAYLQGNVIELGDGTMMNVVDACAGLSMLNLFLALAASVAILAAHRPAWERIAIFASAVPIALIVNPMRITVEGLIYYYGGRFMSPDGVAWAAGLFHDQLAPFFMMTLALCLLYVVYEVITRLFVEEDAGGDLRRHLPSAEAAGKSG